MPDKQKYIQQFKQIYQKKTGQILSDHEALGYFEQLVVLVEATYQPIKKKS